MGKPTGFMEWVRQPAANRPPLERIKDWNEDPHKLPELEMVHQAGRCMDCGVPYCHTGQLISGMAAGCPINNLIPEWNDLVYRGQWKEAIVRLHATNNFPEFTGRVCPAPCEGSCTVGLVDSPVTIKAIEAEIADRAWANGWITPRPPAVRTGRRVAVIGSGPSGLACADQLNRAGHLVTVYERAGRIGGLLMYGIPNMKLDKQVVDRRTALLAAEGVSFVTGTTVGADVTAQELLAEFDAVVLATGATAARDLLVPGRELAGIHLAMSFLRGNTRRLLDGGAAAEAPIDARGKHVVVIGGGDTGSDCVGTSNRHGAASVTQLELLPMPPDLKNNPVWPYWPQRLRTSSSHEEGATRDWSVATKRFEGKNGKVEKVVLVRVEWQNGKIQEVAGSEFVLKADLVLLAMGFVSPVQSMLETFGIERDARGNAKASTEGAAAYATSLPKIFAAGDMRRGQSLVVWAIREGRQCAHAVDEFLMGTSVLPR